VKRLLVLAVALCATYAAACGGGGSNPPPPVAPVGFTNASLSGSYAFSMAGEDLSSEPLSRVGSFTADGNGNITAALEDVTDAGNVSQGVQFTTGTYSIQSNGKGTLTLSSTVGTGIQFSIAMQSTTQGVLIQTDLNATSSGSFVQQSATAFSQTAIAGAYAFDVSGIDVNGSPLSIIGQIVTSGGGAVTGGVLDSNDGGATAPSGAVAIPAGGTYVLDPTNGSTFGRGTLNFGGLQFSFYIVDGTHLKLMEIDGQSGFTSGDLLQQTGTIPTQTSAWAGGGFVFQIAGGSVLGTAGPDVRGARVTTNGTGSLSAIALNDNSDGLVKSIGSSSSESSTIYAIDSTAGVAGSGRGTMTFTDSGLGTFSFVFYLVSPTQAFIQDTSAGIIGDGTMLAQTGTFTASSLAGNYSFNWSGVNLGSSQNAPFEVDFVGQYTASSSGSLSGVIDVVELGSTTKSSPAFLNLALSGTLGIVGDGTAANAYSVTTATSPSNTFTYAAYFASPNFAFLIGTNTDRVIAGNVGLQTVPQ
jgi:hypothetical protein